MPMSSSSIHRPPETIIWTPQLPPPKVRNDKCGGVVERMMYWQLLYSANNYFSKTSSLAVSVPEKLPVLEVKLILEYIEIFK